MSRRTLALTDALHRYLVETTVRETDVMRRLRAETDKLPAANMQIAPEQGQFMQLLVELLGGRKVLEIGTFTGYSALWLAGGLAAGGVLICCDVNQEWTTIARRFWQEAGLADRIDLRLGPALETLDHLLQQGAAGSFDFTFIDADKENSPVYYERSLRLLRSGGVVAVDNALQGGKVADPAVSDHDARHRDLNRRVCHDPRVTVSLVPIGDGLLLARKRGDR
ncbi:MAG: SAM-dependent methyltransferase [Phycisphaerales bacterium]|nr:MAG: SAM-dependent methyltransferase [Phycisphaerales bacterium]